jgi:light-regulated signal transduction histidine kinase (bacteriophytochrome)
VQVRCYRVRTEYLDPRATKYLFISLHFPSSYLPPWIRELYQADQVQILRERTSKKASLRYRNVDSTNLETARSYLPGVTADKAQMFSYLDASLVVDSYLWGLITCHSYGSDVVKITPLREVCRSIGDCASSQIERRHLFSRFQLLLGTWTSA